MVTIMKHLLTLSACMITFALQAQLPVLIRDEFNNNNNSWWTGSGDNYSIKIENGKYILTTFQKDQGRLATLTPYFDKQKDFSLEATFVQRSGSDNNGLGLLWGSDGDKYHEFFIACNGYYKIKSPETRDTNINKWVEHKVNPVGSTNVLRVEQRKSKWYYYINDNEVAVTDAFPIYGPRIGIVNYTDMVLEMDNFTFRHDIKINLPANLTTGLEKENLGPLVNSPYDDLGPKVSADGRTILFGVEHSPQNVGGADDREDIWYTTSTDGKSWSKARNMGSSVNTTDANNLAAVSADNNMLLFCKTDGFQVRKRTEDGWAQPEYLNVRFNNESKNMEATLSADGKAILFSSKLNQNLFYRTTDEKDLYVTLQDDRGNWSNPINLGKQINTAEDEISPFLAADGRTLFFASNGRPGYGGYDIFMSKRIGSSWNNWTEPVNLGPEINGTGFDAYYTIPASAEYAYLVTNVGGYGKADLARVRMPDAIKPEPVVLLLGRTLNAKTKNPVSAEILFEDLTEHKSRCQKEKIMASAPRRKAFFR
jgi:hypothetical protein